MLSLKFLDHMIAFSIKTRNLVGRGSCASRKLAGQLTVKPKRITLMISFFQCTYLLVISRVFSYVDAFFRRGQSVAVQKGK